MTIDTSTEEIKDDLGRVTKRIERTARGELISTTEFIYSGDSPLPDKAIKRNPQGEAVVLTEVSRNSAGQEISSVSRNGEGKLLQQTINVYDKAGLLEKRIINGGKPDEIEVWRRTVEDGQEVWRESVEKVDPKLSETNRPPDQPSQFRMN